MDLADFRKSTAADTPPPGLDAPLTGLWWMAKGDWQKAHAAVDNEAGEIAAWVHAHLHRVEGDHDNADYWYRRAGKPVATNLHDDEWAQIAAAVIGGRL